jgi:multiple sugar transport system ATP-binding protein
LEAPSEGKVYLNGKDATAWRPAARDVAFVFQMLSLYPHLTVRDNVAFALRAQGLPAKEAARQAFDMLRRLGMEAFAAAYPEHLSAGDRQRVSLARALVRRPQAFLMDEPLGTLDADLRSEMRETLRSIHNQNGATTVFVTHDQEEAMVLADRIAIMRAGRIVQAGPPLSLYDYPADLYVADFLGSPGMNLMPARREGDWAVPAGPDLRLRISGGGDPAEENGNLWLGVRPESVILTDDGAPCMVEATQTLGAQNLLSLRAGSVSLKAWIPAGFRFREGESVRVSFLPAGCRWFGGAHGSALPWITLEAACPATR